MSCSNIGTDLEYLYKVITATLKLNISWSCYKNFIELGLALDRNEIDLMGNARFMGLTSESNKSWYNTFPTQYYTIGFFVKSYIDSETLHPFNETAWELWLSYLLMTLSLSVLSKVLSKRLPLAFRLSKLFYVLWFVISTLLLELYSNTLTAGLLIRNKATTSFTDLNDLGQKLVAKKCQFAVFHKYIDLEDLNYIFKPKHNLSWASNFIKASITNPPIYYKNKKDLLMVVRNGSCVVGVDFVFVDKSLYDLPCDTDLKVFPDEIPIFPCVYYHKLRWLRPRIDVIIASDAFVELPSLLLKRYKRQFGSDVRFDCDISSTQLQITFHQLFYPFVFLLGGSVFAVTFLILQKIKLRKSMIMKFNNHLETSSISLN